MFHDIRREEDSLGTMDLPRTCLWGIHTQRALENFPVSGIPLQHFPEFIRALAWVKKAAARANLSSGVMSAEKARVIEEVCDEIVAGRWHDAFRVDMIQGHGTCHGGYLFALADSAFALACNSYNEATVAIGCSIDYIAPARVGDTLSAVCIEQSRSGRTGNYDVRIENHQGQLIALFHGQSYKVRGSVLTQETPNE